MINITQSVQMWQYAPDKGPLPGQSADGSHWLWSLLS
jgi:hypothetical protein